MIIRNKIQRKKVFHIITRLDMGGSAQNTLQTCLGLDNDKYDVMLAHGLSLESNMTEEEKQSVEVQIEEAKGLGVRIFPIRTLLRKISPIQDLMAFFSVLRLMIKEKPDIIHTHTSKAGILGRLAAIMTRAPVIIHTMHGHVFYGHFGPMVTRLFIFLDRFFASFTDCMVALTNGEKKDYIAFSVCKEDKIATIHSGVDTDLFMKTRVDAGEKRRALGLTSHGMVIGTIGWLLPIKGPMPLLKAMGRVWQDFPDADLVYVGKGDLKEDLVSQAKNMGVLDKVKFLGWRDDIPEIMQVLDILVLPSMNEGMGRVLVEAMAAGKPVVASNVGGVPDLVKHDHNGFLVHPGDINGLSVAIGKLLASSEMRDQMGGKGSGMADEFSLTKMVDKIDALYASFYV